MVKRFVALFIFTAISTCAQSHSATLKWTKSVDTTAVGYEAYRATISGGPFTLLATLGDVATYTDTSVQAGTTYYYAVKARNALSAESGPSNQVQAVIPGSTPPPTNYLMTANPVSLSFTGQSGGTAIASKTIIISDTTPQSLPLISIVSDQPWITVVPASGQTQPSTNPFKITVGINAIGLGSGMYSGNVTVTAGTTALGYHVNNSPFKIPVTLALSAPPPPLLTMQCSGLSCSLTPANIPSGTQIGVDASGGGASAHGTVTIP